MRNLQLILIATLLLAACTKQSGVGLKKDTAEYDLFQKKSIARVGLNMKLALTFDDGPKAATTDLLLDLLEREGIKATFFLNGSKVKGNEATMRRMHEDGHVVANHSFEHVHLPKTEKALGMREIFRQVNESHIAIQPYLQPAGRLYFRAPFGAWNPLFADYLNEDQVLRDYIGPVFWDIGGNITRHEKTGAIIFDADGSPATAADWDCWTIPKGKTKQNLTIDQCTKSYYKETVRRSGGIVLMHDVHAQTIEMVKKLIPAWRKAGFTFVTLDQIQAFDQYTSPDAIARAQAETTLNGKGQ